MLSLDDARAQLFARVPRTGVERVSLAAARGRVLAADVLAPADFPGFDYSAMDGYAVASADLAGEGPWSLPVAGESRAGAGDVASSKMERGTVWRIFTGAELPPGADAVVMQEDVERDGSKAVFRRAPRPGAHVRRRGEDIGRGQRAIAAGTRLGASHLAFAAAADLVWLDVARRPRVTIVSTGDELRSPGTAPRPGSIVDSNATALGAMARFAGADVSVAPFVRDDLESTVRAFEAALASSDVLVSIGGVSVGEHDHVRDAFAKVGVTLEFWRVAIKPGKPIAFGRRGDAVVLGLPGNPASAMITFAAFGAPLLRAMQGDARPLPRTWPARLAHAVSREPGRTELARGAIERAADGTWTARLLSNQASGAVTSMAKADALVIIAAEARSLAAGDVVEVLPFEEIGT